MKKLIYIANIRLPTEKAHGIQIMKMCEAFSVVGNNVELVVPWRFNAIRQDPFEYYEIKNNFKITKLPSFDSVRFGKIGFLIQSISFAVAATAYVLFRSADVIYSRDESPLFLLGFFRKNLFWEAHAGKSSFLVQKIIARGGGVIAITRHIKDFLEEAFGTGNIKIVVEHDAVDIDEFNIHADKKDARMKLGLSLDKKIVMYVGSMALYEWKGVDVMLEASRYADRSKLFVFVGGSEGDIAKAKGNKVYTNVLFIKHQDRKTIPLYMKAADCLVLPNKSGNIVSEKYTSPMKLFEYMASRTPIVASDLPSIREILNESNSILVVPNDPVALAKGISSLLNDHDLQRSISACAYEDVKEHSWKKRALRVTRFIETQWKRR